MSLLRPELLRDRGQSGFYNAIMARTLVSADKPIEGFGGPNPAEIASQAEAAARSARLDEDSAARLRARQAARRARYAKEKDF